MNTPEQARKLKVIAAVGGLIGLMSVGFIVYAINGSQKPMATDHASYYPEKTAFYAEASPGPALANRLVKFIDVLQAQNKASQKTGGDKALPVPALPGERKLSEIYNKLFEPQFSMGFWDFKPMALPKSPLSPKTPASVGSFLGVLTTKKGVTLQQIIEELKINPDSVTITPVGEGEFQASVVSLKPHPATQPKAESPVMALHKNHLLFASSRAVVDQALTDPRTRKTVLENEQYKKHLGLLPKNRQGTILMSSKDLQNFDTSDPETAKALAAHPTMKKYLEVNRQFADAVPVTLISMVVEPSTRVIMDVYNPVFWDWIQDESLRKDIKALLTDATRVDLPDLLPQSTLVFFGISNLPEYYDLYLNHMASDQDKQTIGQFDSQLGMFGLTLRQNLIACLEGRFGISVGAPPNQGKFPDVMVFLNYNEQTKKTVDQLGSLLTNLAKANKVERSIGGGQHTLTLLEIPRAPVQIAYGDVLKDTLAFGTASGVEGVFNVEQKKADSLARTELYKKLSTGMPDKVNGFVFLNLKEFANVIQQQSAKAPMPANAKQNMDLVLNVLRDMEGLLASNFTQGDDLVRARVTFMAGDTPAQLTQ